MELFGLNQDVVKLEEQFLKLQGIAQLIALVHLAWYLRQRDCTRALVLADQADAALLLIPNKDLQLRSLVARSLLLRAEIKLLYADFAAAKQLNRLALTLFNKLEDRLGIGDCHWLNASIFIDEGKVAQVVASLDSALVEYRLANDPLRIQIVQARHLVYAAFRDPVATGLALQATFPVDGSYPAPVLVWSAMARASVAALTNDLGISIKHYLLAYRAGLDCGQIRQALVAANNAAESFCIMGDLGAGLEWREVSLALARNTHWPASIGFCLVLMGDIMRQLARYGEAMACAQEALTLLEGLQGSRNYELALKMLGQLELDMGHAEQGLAAFSRLEGQLIAHDALSEPDLLIIAWCGQAKALFMLAQPQAAIHKADAALQLAREHDNAEGQIHALHIMAQTHAAFSLPAPEGMSAPSASLHFLNLELAVVATIRGYGMSFDLYTEIAAAHAACGNFVAAYENSQAAAAAHKKTYSLDVEKRTLAMQIRLEVERAHAETEHHRQVAATLKTSTATLETLGTIGREITACLNAKAVFESLHRYVDQLLDVTSFVVFLLDEQQDALNLAFGIENGEVVTSEATTLNSPSSKIARCARERREVLIHLEPDNDDVTWVPGTLETLSLLFAPLLIGERLLGVMSIQTPSYHAYGERELSIFLTLSAYGAIALDNAAAYAAAERSQGLADQALSELRQTQGELIQREKLASLGSLVAGVAHELNTPIGNSLLVASTLRDESERFLLQIQAGNVRRSELERYCQNAEESSSLLMRCLLKAAGLITSFKQIAVDQTSDQRRLFDLRTECEDVVLMLSSRLRGAGHELKLDISDDLQMDSFPGAFGQVLSNLIINAIVHGFEANQHGLISVQGAARGEQHVVLVVKDNGRGISKEHIDRVFEPFFTTQLGQGGSGLGLHISYNIIQSVLGGQISVSSPAGEGAIFEIVLPRVAV